MAPPAPAHNHATPPLAADERALLRDVGLGLDNKAIAARHGVTPKTISNRLSLLYTKIQVQNRVHAAFYAVQHGLVTLQEAIAQSTLPPRS